MSAIDEIISAIDNVIGQVTEATTATSAIVTETEQALEQVQAVGVTSAVEGFTELKEELEAIVTQFGNLHAAFEEAQATAKAVTDSST
jgi:hypothetical protein